MSSDPLHNLLAELGAARAAGVFGRSGERAGGRFPWEPSGLPAAHRGLKWLRVAAPLSAAAAIAIAFVGLNLVPSHPATAPTAANLTVSTTLGSPSFDGDCNGDGQVNGEDISCFVIHHADRGEEAALQAEELTRRLLGA